METAIAIATLINALTPAAAEIILLIKKKNGTVSVVALLDEADAQFSANIQQANDWLAAHKG